MTAQVSFDGGLRLCPDGTVKQRSPLTGTEVWTVPGRGDRPVRSVIADPQPLSPSSAAAVCAFCPDRYQEVPPELSRLVPGGEGWQRQQLAHAEDLAHGRAAFRLVPNLFPILSTDYWRSDHGVATPPGAEQRAIAYLATKLGRAHLRALAPGRPGREALLQLAAGFFASTHRLVVARDHFRPGATTDDDLLGSGGLGPATHRAFIQFTVDALAELSTANPIVEYVAVFQNWLRPAGASFDHLHKQLVAVDEYGPAVTSELALLKREPWAYQERVLRPAVTNDLVIASNPHAVAVAGVGHRYPTIELYSKSQANLPWEHSLAGLNGLSDLLHACHAATGNGIPSNEEWHYRPPRADTRMPWRVNLKWRISTPAGFEGATKIHVNTISPGELAQRVRRVLTELRAAGAVADLAIGRECPSDQLRLHYAE